MALFGSIIIPISAHCFAAAPIQTAAPEQLKDNQELRVKVSIEATNIPLSDVLTNMSKAANVNVSAEAAIGRQRVTLRANATPLYTVMARLRGLLSHRPAAPRGYYWEKLGGQGGKPVNYRLWRDAWSKRDEQDELNFPHRKSIQLLTELRNLARAPEGARKKYRGDVPSHLIADGDIKDFRDGLANLSDTDFDSLIATGTAPLDIGLFSAQIAAYNQNWRDSQTLYRQQSVAGGSGDPFPNGVPDSPNTPPSIAFRVDDYDGLHPERASLYGIYLNGIQLPNLSPGSGMHIFFDPYQEGGQYRTKWLDEGISSSEPVIDLTPLLRGPAVSPKQRGDLAFTLQTLAKVAHISLFEESFYKGSRSGALSMGLQTLKGTVPQLLNAICMEWGYRATKIGEDYYLWSVTWAYDRSIDIPEQFLTQLRSRDAKQGGLTVFDRAELAYKLSWPQLCLTLNIAFDAAGRWTSPREVENYRIVSRLSVAEQRQLERGGLRLDRMERTQRETLITTLTRPNRTLGQNSIDNAFLSLSLDTAGNALGSSARSSPRHNRYWLQVQSIDSNDTKAPHHVLWQCVLFNTLSDRTARQ